MALEFGDKAALGSNHRHHVALHCGCREYRLYRKMELIMLEWGDIDFGERLLFVRNKPEYDYHTKSYKPRTVPLKENAFNALLIRKKIVADTSRYVFPNSLGRARVNNLLRDL